LIYALVVHLYQLLQQLLLSTGSSLNSSGTNWTNSSSCSNKTARLALLLNSNSNCLLWAGTRPASELPLSSWTASHCSVLLNRTGLSLFCPMVSGVWPKMSSHGETTDFRRRWSLIVNPLLWERKSTTSLDSYLCLVTSKHVTIHFLCQHTSCWLYESTLPSTMWWPVASTIMSDLSSPNFSLSLCLKVLWKDSYLQGTKALTEALKTGFQECFQKHWQKCATTKGTTLKEMLSEEKYVAYFYIINQFQEFSDHFTHRSNM
jgi:hypothetical protein